MSRISGRACATPVLAYSMGGVVDLLDVRADPPGAVVVRGRAILCMRKPFAFGPVAGPGAVVGVS
jgi:hypothetical protein